MKRLLIALLMIPTMGKAEALFETSNRGGGKIVLTDEYCSDGERRLAYATHPNSDTQLGCWTADSSHIHVKWYDSPLRSYDYTGWVDKRKKKSNT